MISRRDFIKTGSAAAVAGVMPSAVQAMWNEEEAQGATFILVADTHYSSVDENHPASLAMVKAINRTANEKLNVGKAEVWPMELGGKATTFSVRGQQIAKPEGIVHLGDMTDNGKATELAGGTKYLGLKTYLGFQQFWEHDQVKPICKVDYPVYTGLGNHDLDVSKQNRERMWQYVESRHKGGKKAPVPVDDFDNDSLAYAKVFGVGGKAGSKVRVIQLQRFASDVAHGKKSSLGWLEQQLKLAKEQGEKVLLCQHYGFDPFGLQPRWWTDKDREALMTVLKGQDHVIGLCHGHSHATGHYKHEGLNIFRCNNMGWELKRGNHDGHGSFALVHVTDTHFNLVHVDCIDNQGNYKFRPDHWVSMEL